MLNRRMLFRAFRPPKLPKTNEVTASVRTQISYFAALSAATYAALRRESRKKFTEATVFDRKSGVAAPRLPNKGLGFASSRTDSNALDAQQAGRCCRVCVRTRKQQVPPLRSHINTGSPTRSAAKSLPF